MRAPGQEDATTDGAQPRSRVDIGVLGPLEISVDGVSHVIAGFRRRALLARLALAVPSALGAEQLADDVFEDAPHLRSIATLRTYVAKVRQQLPGGRDLIVSGPAGYRLAIEPDALDARRFEQLVEAHRADDDPAARARGLTIALAAWRGRAYQEFDHLDWARPESVRLDELRLLANELAIEARLLTGEDRSLVSVLQALTDAHPLHERFHVQLVLALYRSERQTDALRAQRRATTILRDELGLEPTSELAGLEARILDHDPTLDGPGDRITVVVHPAAGPSQPSGPPLPAVLHRHADSTHLVGRDAEMTTAAAALARATVSGARLLLVAGESGIGKTTLAAHIAAAAKRDGAVVLHGRCDEHLRVPYQPFVEALREQARTMPADTLVHRFGSDPSALGRLAPGLLPAQHLDGSAPAVGDSAAEHHRLFLAVADWLRSLSAAAPVVVVLDDLHWATGSTATMLRHVIADLALAPVLFVATVRRHERIEQVVTDSLAAITRDGLLDHIELGGIDRDAARSLLGEHAPTAPADGRDPIDELVAATGGNPFILRELGRDGQVVERIDDVPASVRDVLLARVDRLAPASRSVLRTAASMGLEFELELVATAAATTSTDTLAALDAAVAAGLVREIDGSIGTYQFGHAILRRTVESSVTAASRAATHERIARALETSIVDEARDAGVWERIAAHWQAAGPRHAMRAASALVAAGRAAAAVHAYDEAAQHFAVALDLGERAGARPGWRGDVLLDVATVQAMRGLASTARDSLIEAAGIARAVGDPSMLGRVALGAAVGGRGVSTWVADERRVDLLREASVALTSAADLPLRVLVDGELALALFRPDQRAERQHLARIAVDEAERDGGDEAIAAAFRASRVRFWHPADAPPRREFADRVCAIAEAQRDPWLLADAHELLRGDCLELGDRAGFDAAGRRLAELANQVGTMRLRWRVAVCDALDATLAGRLDDAERSATAALLTWGDEAAPDAVQTYGYQIAVLRLLQGRAEEALALGDAALALQPDVLATQAARSLPLAMLGRADEAAAVVRSCVADDLALLPQDSTWAASAAMLADAAALVGDRDACAVLHEALAPLADRFTAIAEPGLTWGSLAGHVGRLSRALGREREAQELLRRACELEEAFGAIPWLARNRALLT